MPRELGAPRLPVEFADQNLAPGPLLGGRRTNKGCYALCLLRAGELGGRAKEWLARALAIDPVRNHPRYQKLLELAG